MWRAVSSALPISWCVTGKKKKITTWQLKLVLPLNIYSYGGLWKQIVIDPDINLFKIFEVFFFMQRKTSKMYFKNKFRYLGTKPQNSLKYIFRLICFSKTYCLLSNEVYMEWSHFLRASDFLGTFKKYFSEHLSNKYLPFQDFFMTIILH